MKANQYYAGACVVITGAGSGIGRLMALRIVEEGGRVAIWDINGEAAQTTADMARLNRFPMTPPASPMNAASIRKSCLIFFSPHPITFMTPISFVRS